MGFFKWDSPAMQAITKGFEYMFLWFLCIVFSIPVITFGAAVTAQFTISMRMVRGEDTPIFSGFVKAFIQNFKQSTVIWLIELAAGIFLLYDWYLVLFTNEGVRYGTYFYILIVFSVIYLMTVISTFPLMARFKLKNFDVIRGAFVFGLINIPKMVFIIFLLVAPYILGWFRAQWLVGVLPVSAAATLYIISAIYVKSFKKVEERVTGNAAVTSPKKTEEETEILQFNEDSPFFKNSANAETVKETVDVEAEKDNNDDSEE